MSGCGWLLIIIVIIVVIIIIYYLYKNKNQPLPNDGVVNKLFGSSEASPTYNQNNDNLSPQYGNISDKYFSSPNECNSPDQKSDQYGKFDGYLQKKQLNMKKMELPYSDDRSDDRKFTYNKKCFTKRTPEDIKDLFDINKMMPQEIEDWFDVEPLQSTKKIKGSHMIHPKEHMGIDTVANTLRNASHDIRGDIPNPKTKVSPWNNSTIEPDTNIRGICN